MKKKPPSSIASLSTRPQTLKPDRMNSDCDSAKL